MGLGHAVYKTGDPRARILAPMSKKLGERSGDTKWYDMSITLEERGKKAFKEKKGHGYLPECGFLQRVFVQLHGNSRGSFYACFRGVPHCRMGQPT